jgi:hypothetical protein
MRLLQYVDNQHTRVARVDDNGLVTPFARLESMYALARRAISERKTLEQVVSSEPTGTSVAYADIKSRLLPPLTHPDPAH